MKSIFILLLIPTFSFAQPKGTNQITVKGVSFRQTAIALLDAGYSFEKIDSNFQIIKTEPKGEDKMFLNVRVKDTLAIITGSFSWVKYNNVFAIENMTAMDKSAIDPSEEMVRYFGNMTYFKQMNDFALSFKKPVEYSIIK